MTATIQTILLLLAVLVVVAVLARRLNIAASILLVVAGIALALVPGLPRIALAPELVLFGILPPLIYSAGVAMSWREFKFNLRPIALLAFGLVIFSAAAVAVAVHYLLGMPLAVGFVLGAVAAGLYVSWNGPLLIPAATRLQGIFFWDLLIYLLEGLLFLVTGLQLRILIERTDPVLLHQLALAVPLVVAVVLLARFIWVYPAAYLPRWLSASLARRDPVPTWQFLFMLGFTGVRGVVSLAAALALPLTTSAGAPFPERDLILFVAFGVIVVTLIGEGVVLAPVVRWLALPRDADEERRRENAAELKARLQTLKVAEGELERLATDGSTETSVLELLRSRQANRARQVPKDADGKQALAAALALRAELINAERAYIYRLLQEGQITDEARRRIERELDLEEATITLKREDEDDPPL